MINISKNVAETIRIDRHEYRGQDVIDVRVWVQGDKLGEMVATRKGISFRREILPEIIKALQDVLDGDVQSHKDEHEDAEATPASDGIPKDTMAC